MEYLQQGAHGVHTGCKRGAHGVHTGCTGSLNVKDYKYEEKHLEKVEKTQD